LIFQFKIPGSVHVKKAAKPQTGAARNPQTVSKKLELRHEDLYKMQSFSSKKSYLKDKYTSELSYFVERSS